MSGREPALLRERFQFLRVLAGGCLSGLEKVYTTVYTMPMLHSITLKELRPGLPRVVDRIDGRLDRYVVTRRGKPVVVMLSVDDYESLMETLDILADPEAMAGLRRGEGDLRRGRTRSWKDIRRSLARL